MKKFVVIVGCLVILSGCFSQSVFDKETEKVKNKNAEKLLDDDALKKKWEEFYEPQSRPMDEVVSETANDVTIINESPIEVKQTYTDPEQFAVFISDNIYRFMKGELKPKEYLKFLVSHSSNLYKKKHLIEDKEKDIQSLTLIQKALQNEAGKMKSYRVSVVQREEFNSDVATFYREVTLDTGQKMYYLTSIVEENGGWKFDDDRLSGPVQFEARDEKGEKR